MSNGTPTLKAYRKEAGGMSLEQLGNLFGVHKTTVSRWERKKVPPERVIEIEARTGVPRQSLRPDLYPSS
jgi:DNA-binding transcriptional regulator YdaS (Cro superfamily)